MNAFEKNIQRQVDRLQTCSLREIEKSVSEKRLAWWQEHAALRKSGRISPRYAFECLFFEYMGLKKEDLPILSETEDEITWASKNPCPTLSACERLGLDTRRVCRQVYEKSTQVFLSQLDPQLRFTRSYVDIRPHAAFCRESIIRLDFESAMHDAIAEAHVSHRESNKGYGAVLWHAGKILSRTHDTAGTQKDPSLHAEVNAIRQACRELDDSNLCGAVLISSCEPCPMCASLAVWANVSAIVYGASIEETAAQGKSRILVPSREIVEKSPVQIEIIPGVLREEALALYL
ncbi:MAG: nucleoside deaminase [Leptolinea sp.]|jgi:guanine deaminase|nr:nucleoside deaminase [Leptolinea sp.]